MPLFTPSGLPRWLNPTIFFGVVVTSQTFTVGRVIGAQFAVLAPCQVDGVAYTVGTTAAGNVTGGILAATSRTADSMTGATVVAQSASTAQATQSTAQFLSWTAVWLQPGIYYAVLEGSDATGTYMRQSNMPQAAGGGGYYDRAGGYGALTDPTPTATETNSAIPGIRIRVV